MPNGITERHVLEEVIKSPTCVTEHLQLICCFTNAQQKVNESHVLDRGLSNHSEADFLCNEEWTHPGSNKDSFVAELRQVTWHVAVNYSDDIDDCVDTWNKFIFLEVAD